MKCIENDVVQSGGFVLVAETEEEVRALEKLFPSSSFGKSFKLYSDFVLGKNCQKLSFQLLSPSEKL